MALIKRDQVQEPALRSEAVTVEPFGGDVLVRELTLTQRLALKEAGSEEAGGNTKRMLHMLHLSVVDADGAHVFTAEQWDAFGAKHQAVVQELFVKAVSVSGFDGEKAKKN